MGKKPKISKEDVIGYLRSKLSRSESGRKPSYVAVYYGVKTASKHSEDKRPDKALAISAPHGINMLSGDKLILVSPRRLRYLDENLYLLQDDMLLGIVRLSDEQAIDLDAFGAMELEHHISPSEREFRWPDASSFFAYKVFPVFSFKQPFLFKHIHKNTPFVILNMDKKLGI